MSISFTPAELEQIHEDELATVYKIKDQLAYELNIQKGRADHWRELCDKAFKMSQEACFTRPGSKEGREKRDNLIGAINKLLGGAIR